MKIMSAFFSLSILLPMVLFAADDKNRYHLFNPTPINQMRELSTDRPDKTESPYTVDAGHYQLETDIVTYRYNHDRTATSDESSRGFGVAVNNFKAGLTNNTDLQVVVESYAYTRTRDRLANTVDRADGFGDITVRLKHNLWGNDGGKTAFAVMPFVTLPTNQNGLGNNDLEGGVILPFAFSLGGGFDMGVMTQIDINKDNDDDGYRPAFINSATIATDLTDDVGGYMELFTSRDVGANAVWDNSLDFGITYAARDNLQLDAGINIGISDAADDYNPFIGVSYRL